MLAIKTIAVKFFQYLKVTLIISVVINSILSLIAWKHIDWLLVIDIALFTAILEMVYYYKDERKKRKNNK